MVKFSVHHATAWASRYYGREEMLKSAQKVEELGNYALNTCMDHLNWYPDGAEIYSAYLMAAEMASVTTKPGVGIMVTDMFRTHPVQMALHAMHLQRMSGNRFHLGLGAGEAVNSKPWGIDASKPVSRLEEAVQVIKQLLGSSRRNKVTFNGEYYKMKRQFLQFPTEDPPKIWLAAASPRTLGITAKYADGWVPVGYSPALYKQHAEIVRGEGRDVEMGLNAWIAISKDAPDDARNVMKLAGSVLCLRPEILGEHGIEVTDKVDFVDHFQLPNMRKQKSHAGSALQFCMDHDVPEEAIMSTVLAGSPDDVIGQLERMIAAGCEHFFLQFMGKEYWDQLELFSKDVIPHFQD